MKLKKRTLLRVLFALLLLLNAFEILRINFLYSLSILGFVFYLFIPGLLILLIFNVKKIDWEIAFLSLGSSLVFLEFGGLLINSLVILAIKEPLRFDNLLLGFDLLYLVLFYLAFKKRQFLISLPSLKFSRIKLFYCFFPLIFPILAIFGAFSINNHGSNFLTMFLLGLVAIYSLFLVKTKEQVSTSLYAFTIFFVGLALLFTTSLRGWFITGHDITREYFVFFLTNSHHLWNISFYKDAYNACLSITILPTILTNLLMVNDMYVYKIIYQIIFAFCPVVVFYIQRKYISEVKAFLCVLFFMAFPTFYNDMPMLNRQEIGFLLFGLVLYIFLTSSLPNIIKETLFLLFFMGVVVSHYSTNYVLLIISIMTYVLTLFFTNNRFKNLRHLIRMPIKGKFLNTSFINISIILVMFIFTYFWNNQVTNTTSHFGTVLSKVWQNIFLNSKSETRSADVVYSLFFSKQIKPEVAFQAYMKDIVEVSKSKNESNFIKNAKLESYPVALLKEPLIQPTFFGRLLRKYNFPVRTSHSFLRQISAIYVQIAVFLGLAIMIFLKSKNIYSLQYLSICITGVVLLLLVIVLPNISAEYGLLRLFQQLLFVFCLPIIIATEFIFAFYKINENQRLLGISIIAVIFFLTLTGFVSHITGDYFPQMTLDNEGIYYDAYYSTQENVSAVKWLSENQKGSDVNQSDLVGNLNILSYAQNPNVLNELFPQVILEESYVYFPNIKEARDRGIVSISQDTFRYTSPEPFLNDYKDLIYNNGKDGVYR